MYRSIAIPLDGSLFSEQALPTAELLASRTHATVHLVHVHVPVVRSYVEGFPLDDLDVGEDVALREHQAAYLERVRSRITDHLDVEVRTSVLDAPVVPAINDYVQAHGIDAIVMTTHGRGGFTRLWLGSTADRMLRESHVPVLLHRPTEDTLQPTQPPSFKHILIGVTQLRGSEPILSKSGWSATGTVEGRHE